MGLFFTSDQHFGHRAILGHCDRPFRDLDHMAEELIARHNAVVRVDDEVYHLGDFALDDRLVAPILKKLSGRHRLIVGNHDRCHQIHKRHVRDAARYKAAGFETVLVEAEMIIPELGCVRLHHMPYVGDRSPEVRYADIRPRPRGEAMLLHGHVHEKWLVRHSAELGEHPIMVNVGVDVWSYAPVCPAQIAELLKGSS